MTIRAIHISLPANIGAMYQSQKTLQRVGRGQPLEMTFIYQTFSPAARTPPCLLDF